MFSQRERIFPRIFIYAVISAKWIYLLLGGDGDEELLFSCPLYGVTLNDLITKIIVKYAHNTSVSKLL